MESTVNPKEFQKLISHLMREKYTHEQRVADNDLSRHRQRCERSRSASRTPEKRRSLSNTSLGSRAARHRSASLSASNAPAGRPPHIPPRNPTPASASPLEAGGVFGESAPPKSSSAPDDAADSRAERRAPSAYGAIRSPTPDAARTAPPNGADLLDLPDLLEKGADLPDDPAALGATLETRFLTVVTALARRVRRVEADLDASLAQLRVLEAAALERDARLQREKVSHDEVDDCVTRALHRVRLDFPNEVSNLYRLWSLDPRAVREALRHDEAAATALLLSTPPFARVMAAVMESGRDLLAALHTPRPRAETPTPPPMHEARLGLRLRDARGGEGVRVAEVLPRSPAAHAVRAGDVIAQVNHVTVRSIADVAYVLSRGRTYAPISLSVHAPDGPYVEVVQVLPLEVA